MEISDLLSKIKGNDKVTPKPFLALELTDEIVVSAVWQVEDNKTVIVSTGTPIEWHGDQENSDELVTAVDGTVSSAIEGLGLEPDQVIFGVAANWANEAGILPTKLTLIKKICKEMDFKPLGFVVVTDSLLRYLKMQEGVPTSSILVHIAREEITITLVRLGKIEGSEVIGRGDDIVSDVEEGISRFENVGELPSRISVFDGMHNLEEEVQNLLVYDWKSKFPFLHIPKIEALPKDIVIKSIALAGGSEVAKAIGFEITDPEPMVPSQETEDVVATVQENIENISSVSEPIPHRNHVVEILDDEPENEPPIQLASAVDFGFGVPSKKLPPTIVTPPSTKIKLDDEPPLKTGGMLADFESEDEPNVAPHAKPPKLRFTAPRTFRPPQINLPKFKFPRLSMPSINNLGLVIGVLIIMVIVSFMSAVWLLPKAQVTIFVEPKNLQANLDLTLSTSASAIDQENKIIPAQSVEKSVSGEESMATTGTKTVGDPAKGEVTIYNRTSLAKTFNAGTTISLKSLKFALDTSVTVASKSAGADYVDVPGRANVKVTAKAIGVESNLPAGSEFNLENFTKDTYVAKNESAFSGGTSREVQVVDAKDKAALRQSLFARLRTEAQGELASELGSAQQVYVLEKSSTIEEEKYSVEVGSESSDLTATMTVAAKGVSYSSADIESLMASTLEQSKPAGYVRTASAPQIEVGKVLSEDQDKISMNATINVDALPVVDESIIQQSLRGVSREQAEQTISNVIGFQNADIFITPTWLPKFLKKIPRNPANISVKVLPVQ